MDGLDRRRLLGMVAGAGAAGLTAALTGCTSTPSAPVKPTLRIGLLVPATGANKSVGADMENGFDLYLKATDGKLNGHPINIIQVDEGETTESGEAALGQLFDAQVLAVVGVANSELLPRVQSIVEQKQVPLLAAHAAPSSMASAFYIWRTAFLNSDPAKAIASYLKRRGTGRVGLIGLQNPLNTELLDSFAKDYGSEANTPAFVSAVNKPEKSHFQSILPQLLNGNPNAIYCELPANYVVPFMQALRDAGWRRDEVYASGLAAEGAALDQLGKPANGLMTAMHYSADLSNSANRDFSSLYMSEYRTSPSAFTVAAYDAAAVLDRAIALCGANPVTPQRVNQMIGNVGQIVSPRGNWQFNQGRSPQQKWYLRRVGMDGPVLSNLLVSDLATLG